MSSALPPIRDGDRERACGNCHRFHLCRPMPNLSSCRLGPPEERMWKEPLRYCAPTDVCDGWMELAAGFRQGGRSFR